MSKNYIKLDLGFIVMKRYNKKVFKNIFTEQFQIEKWKDLRQTRLVVRQTLRRVHLFEQRQKIKYTVK